MKENKLNDLDGKSWLKFTKSWFVHNPPARKKQVYKHPAKFPESLCEEFIRFFTKEGQMVLDPMAGVGSALVAAVRAGRYAVGIELSPEYHALATTWLSEEGDPDKWTMLLGDARDVAGLIEPGSVNYMLTSPPYWDMLNRQAVTDRRKEREADETQDSTYSVNEADCGNIENYTAFLDTLVDIYQQCSLVMAPKAYATIIVKNLKKGGTLYPLAWDLARRLNEETPWVLKDERIWCQDNVSLFPFALGSAWVSNIHHHYCLQFRNEG